MKKNVLIVFKRVLLIVVVLLSLVSLVACSNLGIGSNNGNGSDSGGNNNNNNSGSNPGLILTTFNVYFYVDNEVKYYMNVSSSQIFKAPDVPEKKNFKAIGWADINGVLQTFDQPYKKQTNFYAVYEPDYAALINIVTTQIISSNVLITKTSYNKNWLGMKKDVISHIGSGIIFHNSDGFYYIITNEHVTKTAEGRSYADFVVTDYKGNEYSAKKYNNSEQARYDLSTLYITAKTEKLNVINRAKTNPKINDEIIAMGQPKGQNNAVTFGKVKEYKKVTLSTGFSTFFDALVHDAPTAGGSSGGAILDLNFNLVGVHFAGSTTASGQFVNGISIPIETVNEYLANYVYSK